VSQGHGFKQFTVLYVSNMWDVDLEFLLSSRAAPCFGRFPDPQSQNHRQLKQSSIVKSKNTKYIPVVRIALKENGKWIPYGKMFHMWRMGAFLPYERADVIPEIRDQ